MPKLRNAAFVVPLLLLGFAWLNDFITLQGEWTIYTAQCRGGTWNGDQCQGKLVAGDRHRFRALKARAEVLFWTVGAKDPSGKLTGCAIEDGRNWACPPSAEAAKSVTLQMVAGRPRGGEQATGASHRISKITWLLLTAGLWPGSAA